MSKASFAQGLKKLQPEKQPDLLPETLPPEPAKTQRTPSRVGQVAISGYFEPEVRKQFAIIAVMEDKTHVQLLAEALNLLFEKYGKAPIAKETRE